MYNWYKKNREKFAEIMFWVSISGAIGNTVEALLWHDWVNVAMALGAYGTSLYWLSVLVEEA